MSRMCLELLCDLFLNLLQEISGNTVPCWEKVEKEAQKQKVKKKQKTIIWVKVQTAKS